MRFKIEDRVIHKEKGYKLIVKYSAQSTDTLPIITYYCAPNWNGILDEVSPHEELNLEKMWYNRCKDFVLREDEIELDWLWYREQKLKGLLA